MVDVRRDYPRFQAAGGEVAVITMGTPPQAAAFKQRFELPFPCLADPRREAYQAFAIPRGGVGQIAGPSVWGAGLRAMLRGGGGLPVGDPFQLPGTFLIDRQGRVRFLHRPATSADHPDHEELLRVLGQLSAD